MAQSSPRIHKENIKVRNQFMEIRFSQIEESRLSDIQYKLSINEKGLGILSFHGICGYGSEGNSDGEFMHQISRATVLRDDITKLIVDFSGLNYQWGNYITKVLFNFYDASVPVAIIYSEHCKAMLPPDTTIFFDNRQEAMSHIDT